MKSVKELAEAIGQTPDGVRRACREGRIKAERVGWAYVIADAVFERVVESHRAKGPEQAV